MRRPAIAAIVLTCALAAAYLYPNLTGPRSQGASGASIGAYYVRQWSPDAAQTARSLQAAIADAVAKSGSLPGGYPRHGVVRQTPTGERNVFQLECVPSDEAAGRNGCLLLGPTGGHVRVSWLETGQTEARFHPFTVYVRGVWPWQAIEPITTQRVVVDVALPDRAGTAASPSSVYDAIGEALATIGAREY